MRFKKLHRNKHRESVRKRIRGRIVDEDERRKKNIDHQYAMHWIKKVKRGRMRDKMQKKSRRLNRVG